MAIVIPTGFRQVTLVHTGPGASGEVDVVWGISAVGTEADDLEVVKEAWQSEVVEQCLAGPMTFVEARCLSGPRPGTLELIQPPNPALPTAGDQGANMLPLNNAVLWSLVTATGGVRGRGRKYLPGMASSAVDNAGNITSAAVTQFQTAADAFKTAVEAAGLDLVILHSTGVSAVPAPTVVTGIIVQSKMATQRTRLRD